MKPEKSEITRILGELSNGDGRAAERLMPLVYDEFRALAASYFARESSGHTLQPTALVHEAYLRLVDQNAVQWHGRNHFFAVGAILMRRILVDHARGRSAAKRGGGEARVALREDLGLAAELPLDEVLDIDRVLQKLATLDPRQAKIVELRCFAGMGMDEIAATLEVSPRTVDGEWKMVRAWLRRELKRGEASK